MHDGFFWSSLGQSRPQTIEEAERLIECNGWPICLYIPTRTPVVCDSSVSVLLRLGACLFYVLAFAVRKHAKTVPKDKRNRPERKPLRLLISPCVMRWTALCACLCCALVCVTCLTLLYACLCCGLVCAMSLSALCVCLCHALVSCACLCHVLVCCVRLFVRCDRVRHELVYVMCLSVLCSCVRCLSFLRVCLVCLAV